MSAIKLLAEARKAFSVNGVEPSLLNRIDALLKTGGWIPVTERLPEKNTTCLVFLDWIDVGTYDPPRKRVKHDWFVEPAGINPMFNVTHWQSLPPLPEDK